MAKEQARSAAPVVAPPEGMQRSGTATAVGWFNHKLVGNVLSGTLLGIFDRPDDLRESKTSEFFQVKIDVACEVRAERGEDAKMITAQPGDVVNVNYGPKTKQWKGLCEKIEQGAVYTVWGAIQGEKVKLRGGKSMHNFETYHKMVKAPSAFEDDFDDGDGGEGDEQN